MADQFHHLVTRRSGPDSGTVFRGGDERICPGLRESNRERLEWVFGGDKGWPHPRDDAGNQKELIAE
jgi:hypothetical protein